MNIRPRDRVALGVVATIALIAAFYLLALSPQHRRAAQLDAEIGAQRSALTTAQTDYATGKAAQASLVSQASSWTALRKAVPETSDIPALLRVLQRNADAAGVKIQSISLSGASSSSVAAAPSTTTTADSGSSATDIPLQLSFSGGYAALDALVHRLDGLVVVKGQDVRASGPLLTISSVQMSSGSSLTVQITANIYQLSAAASAGAITGGTS